MIVLYSTGCPKCKALAGRLTNNNIKFEVSNDIKELINKGYKSAPMVKINDQYFNYKQVMTMLKEHEQGMITEFGGAE